MQNADSNQAIATTSTTDPADLEDLDVPPLSSCTVDELKQLLSMTRQAYDAYVSQGTDSGKIGARLCAEEIAEIEALIKEKTS